MIVSSSISEQHLLMSHYDDRVPTSTEMRYQAVLAVQVPPYQDLRLALSTEASRTSRLASRGTGGIVDVRSEGD
jgi:hypothetical protein